MVRITIYAYGLLAKVTIIYVRYFTVLDFAVNIVCATIHKSIKPETVFQLIKRFKKY